MNPARVLLLQDWFSTNDLINPSLYALLELYPDAHVGFLKNFETSLPQVLRDRHVEFYASRLSQRQLEDIGALIDAQARIPQNDYDLIISNTRGYLRHLRREKSISTRFVVYQHDLLPFLWRAEVEKLNVQRSAELMRAQELDLEFAAGIDLTIAANYALHRTLSSLMRKDVPLAYPLVDSDLFYPDDEAPPEYFVATDSVDSEMLIRLFSCISDKLVVLAEKKTDKLLKDLKPDNIFYAGKLSVADQAYYIAGAKAMICGETKALEHLPLAALKCGIPLIAHRTQGMSEFLSDGECGVELETGTTDEVLKHVRAYRTRKVERGKIAASVDWLNREYFLRRMRKALEKHS